MGEIRRALSVTVVRANAYCLLERLAHLGPGAGAAAKRREGALRQEEKRRQDRQAFDLAWQSGGSCRVGKPLCLEFQQRLDSPYARTRSGARTWLRMQSHRDKFLHRWRPALN